MSYTLDEAEYLNRLGSTLLYHEAGKVTKSVGIVYEAYLPGASIGSLCRIYPSVSYEERDGVDAEVVGFRDKQVILMPFHEVRGVNNDSLVVLKRRRSAIELSPALLGRVIDGAGNPIDGKGPIHHGDFTHESRSLYARPEDPMLRPIIEAPITLGVKCIDGLLTCGLGQRVGIMAGSGVGKSVLLGMMARNTSAQINVIGLIGERGREVREFIERDLGEEGLKRSVVVVATSDTSALLRMRAAFLAATISEYFRDQGDQVLLMMDSVTRFCMAQREIGLAMGEPPASKGYTPSVFSTLPRLLERAGTSKSGGSITGLYTVLVEGDDMDEPIADAARSILDGHIVLDRRLAERGQFPAVNVLRSASRLMHSIVDPEHSKAARKIKEWMAVYDEAEDLINIGAYAPGANASIDQSVHVHGRIVKFLTQEIKEKASFEESFANMQAILRLGEAFAINQQAAQQQRSAYR